MEQLKEKIILDETGPSDLFKAYKLYNKRGQPYYIYDDKYKTTPVNDDSDVGIDLEHSKYTKLSKDAALNAIKHKLADKLRLLITDRYDRQGLVTLKPDGWGTIAFRVEVPNSKAYKTKSGKTISDTAHMPGAYLISIADNIYIADEVYKDKDILNKRISQRQTDVEAARAYQANNLAGWSIWDGGTIDTKFAKSFNTTGTKNTDIKSLKDLLDQRGAVLRDRIASGNLPSDFDFDSDYVYKHYKDRYQKAVNNIKNDKAKLRYSDSFLAGRNELKDIQKSISLRDDAAKAVEGNKQLVQDIKELGATSTRISKDELASLTARLKAAEEEYKRTIKELKRQKAILEFDLSDTSVEDTEALENAQAKLTAAQNSYDKTMSDLGPYKDKLDKLAAIKAKRLNNSFDGDKIMKFTLNEDVEIENSPLIIDSLIKGEWELVDQLNGASIAFGDDARNEIIKDIIEREYINIGQLEKLLQIASPDAAAISAASAEEVAPKEDVAPQEDA